MDGEFEDWVGMDNHQLRQLKTMTTEVVIANFGLFDLWVLCESKKTRATKKPAAGEAAGSESRTLSRNRTQRFGPLHRRWGVTACITHPSVVGQFLT